jgi:GNAT superfamily N-acetyltransferase
MPTTIHIIPFEPRYKEGVIRLILSIQQGEFGIPITIDDQPDLQIIPDFYQQRKGNFWIAVTAEGEVVGTIALIDYGAGRTALRKMFVAAPFRGGELKLGQKLMDNAENWCRENGLSSICLGTIPKLVAACRFYERNGFQVIDAENLPPEFPRMAVDTRFYWKDIA